MRQSIKKLLIVLRITYMPITMNLIKDIINCRGCSRVLGWWEEIINPKLGQKLTLGSTIGCPTNRRLKCNLDNLFDMQRSESAEL